VAFWVANWSTYSSTFSVAGEARLRALARPQPDDRQFTVGFLLIFLESL